MRPTHAPAPFSFICRLGLAFPLALGGCAHYIAVRHLVAPRNLPGSDLQNLSRIVLVMQLEPVERPAGILGRAALDLLQEASDPAARISLSLPRPRTYQFLRTCSRMLSSPISHVECSLIDGPFSTVFIDAQQPSAVLILKPSRITSVQKPEEIRDRKGDRHRTWHLQADFILGYRLLSWPDRRELANGRLEEIHKGTSREQVSLPQWAGELDVGESVLANLRRDLLPVTLERFRLVKKGKTSEMKKARKAARQDDWEVAYTLWDAEAGAGDPDALWNLGLYYERRGDWEKARERYARARESAAKRKDRTRLNIYLGELDEVLPPGSPPGLPAGNWFAQTVAVLPFGNQSNDVDAPERIRRLAWNRLQEMGYRPLPLEETSALLREKGVTQGEQLKTLSLAETAQHLGGARMLTGTIRAFKTVNVGLYNLHTVSVHLAFYDPAGRLLMESDGEGFREILVDPKQSGRSFLFGLAETAVTKAARIYLEEESRDAVATGLEVLPARAPGF